MSDFNTLISHGLKKNIESLGKGFEYVVYTALYGDVDKLHDPLFKPEDNILFVCFTDKKDIKSSIWNIVNVQRVGDTRISAKYWKFFGYSLFIDNAKYSIWVDASIQILESLNPLFDDVLRSSPSSSIMTFKHPKRTCAYSELFWIFLMGKDSIYSLLKTFLYLQKNKYMCGNGLIAGTVILRKHLMRQKLDSLMVDWWHCVINYSSRDQLTFNYLIEKEKYNGIHDYIRLEGNVYNCRFFKGVRVVKFDSRINPKSKTNLRHKLFHLILSIRSIFKK